MSIELESHIEAVLLAHGEPIKVKKLASVLKASEEEVKSAVDKLRQEYLEQGRGFAILESNNAVQLVSSPESAVYIQRLVKQEETATLSPAALEVLSVVAYRGPVTRMEIDAIRGVNCSHVLRALALRGLIERIEDDQDNRMYRYRVSFDLLQRLGIEHIKELPDYGALSRNTQTQTSETKN